MASEISISSSLSVNKGSLQLSRSANFRADMPGTEFGQAGQIIGFSAHEALAINADIGTKGVAWFRNLDATNYVEIGVQDGSSNFIPFAKLKPGEGYPIRLAS